MTALLVVLAVGFAFSMGAHYTGACMGMPRALGAISPRAALLVMAPLSLIGATFASHGVERTVAHSLVGSKGLSVAALVIVIGVAFGLTSAFNRAAVPTSTIQILVFSVVGAGLAAGLPIHWRTIGTLAVIWVAAPPVAALAGYLFTRLIDRTRLARTEAGPADSEPAEPRSPRTLGVALVAVGALASFAMGSNDVANASGSLVGTHTFSPLVAGLVGGLAIFAGVLTWGRPLLHRVAFEIVTVDRQMATAAQLVQALVVLAAVGFGFFTSMNQALVGAMAGTAAARGRHTIKQGTFLGILRGWVIGPGAGLALSYVIAALVVLSVSRHQLIG